MPPKPSPPTLLSEPAFQYALFDEPQREAIVNVASVPQRSPFRYPGGKTWLIPRVRKWLASLLVRPALLVEPFAGGGSVSLAAACENLVERVLMVECDDQVAAVWQTLLNGDAFWLAEQIVLFDLTAGNVQAALARPCTSVRDKAFQTILKNRVYHGGILAPGSGLLKQGENGKGLSSRWYPQTLKTRMLGIAAIADKMTFVQSDGLQTLRQYAADPHAAFFIDPPYTAAGKKAGARLYVHNELDHEELFAVAASLAGSFLMTYDNAEGVVRLAQKHGFAVQAIPMKNTHHAQMSELLISRNLDWA